MTNGNPNDMPVDPYYQDPYGQMPQDVPMYSSQGTALMGQYDSKVIAMLLDPTQLIDHIKSLLRGVVIVKKWDKKSGQMIDVEEKLSKGKAKINEEGIEHIVYLLNFHVGTHAATTILREEIIIEMTKQFGKDLSLLFLEKWQDFEMDWSTITPIRHSIVRVVYMSLMRSKDGSFLDALTRTYKETYSSASYSQPQGQQMQGGGGGGGKRRFPFNMIGI